VRRVTSKQTTCCAFLRRVRGVLYRHDHGRT
jgi:hypothetical protein